MDRETERRDAAGSYAEREVVEAYAELNDHGLVDAEAEIIGRYFTRTDAAVLDLGCGAGRTTRPLADRGYDVVAVDVSEPMVREAQSHAPGASFAAGDATELGFRDEAFDYALFSFNGIDLLHPAAERHAALREIYRVLEPGGIFAFSARNAWFYPIPPRDPLSPRQWLRAAREVGRDLLRGRVTAYYEDDAYVGTWTGSWEEYGTSHFICPPLQRRQLRTHGFEVLDTVGLPFDSNLHYVARKPPG